MESSSNQELVLRVVKNYYGVYKGDLVAYYKIIKENAPEHPYHNLDHIEHVVCMCFILVFSFYRDKLSKREVRNLLIAALFHDFGHQGGKSRYEDYSNIIFAVMGLKRNILPEDEDSYREIAHLIGLTEFPYKIPTSEISLSAQILRVADVSQALFDDSIDFETLENLAEEWETAPIQVFKSQEEFYRAIKESGPKVWKESGLEYIVLQKLQDLKAFIYILEKIKEESEDLDLDEED